MADRRGAFKANSAHLVRAVKEFRTPDAARPPTSNPNDQKSCKEFSQTTSGAQKIDSLPPKQPF
jgi:hypothetical protein